MKIRQIFIKIGAKNNDFDRKIAKFCEICAKKNIKNYDEFLLNFQIRSGAKECRSCRSRKMRKNAPTLAIVAVHTEENGPNSAEVKVKSIKLLLPAI